MGTNDAAIITSTVAADAAARVRELTASRSPIPARPVGPSTSTRRATSAPPTHLGIVDHMVASRDELVSHTRAEVPAEYLARPVPAVQADVYDWVVESSVYMDEKARMVCEAIMVRQGLEAALLAGNWAVVRKHRCLNCRCLSLTWRPEFRAAACMNLNCSDEQGMTSRFTLAQLAERVVENLPSRVAT